MTLRGRAVIFLGAWIVLGLGGNGYAQNTGASFLKIGVGARAIGMGSAFTAVADDVTATFWNPAGLSQMDKRQIAAMHTDWLTDISYDHVAYAQPTKIGVLAGSLAMLRQGDLERRGDNREKLGNFTAQDNALALSLSRPITARLSYGVTAKWVQESIDDERAGSMAMDIGWLGRAGTHWRWGAVIQNFGPRMKFIDETFNLPLSAAAGINFRLKDSLSLGVDARRYLHTDKNVVSVGTEYWLLSRIALRTGYLSNMGGRSGVGQASSDKSASRLGQLTGLNMGIGLRIYSFQMDYALVPSGEFGNTHRLSLSAAF